MEKKFAPREKALLVALHPAHSSEGRYRNWTPIHKNLAVE
jgi:hypothetical protein